QRRYRIQRCPILVDRCPADAAFRMAVAQPAATVEPPVSLWSDFNGVVKSFGFWRRKTPTQFIPRLASHSWIDGRLSHPSPSVEPSDPIRTVLKDLERPATRCRPPIALMPL